MVAILDSWCGQITYFERGPSKEYLNKNWFHSTQGVLKKIFKDFQYFNQSEAMAAILALSPDTILKEDHLRSITYKFGPIWPSGSKYEI